MRAKPCSGTSCVARMAGSYEAKKPIFTPAS